MDGWYGKVIGAILGYIVGRGLLGAIVGFVIGHQFDVMARRNRGGALGGRKPGTIGAGHGSPAEMRLAFFEATFQVMGHVAKSDGRVSEREIDAARVAMNRFSLSEADRLRAIELFTAGKNPDRGDTRAPALAHGRAIQPGSTVRADPAGSGDGR